MHMQSPSRRVSNQVFPEEGPVYSPSLQVSPSTEHLGRLPPSHLGRLTPGQLGRLTIWLT
jgi:hypothetical protein